MTYTLTSTTALSTSGHKTSVFTSETGATRTNKYYRAELVEITYKDAEGNVVDIFKLSLSKPTHLVGFDGKTKLAAAIIKKLG